MRAGCFAEDRVIHLINRRFIPFYYCTGGPGLGHDAAAKTFVGTKTKNPWAFLAVFHPDGKILGESALYADKDATFAFLRKVLAAHPEAARHTPQEVQQLRAGRAAAASFEARSAAASLQEELGAYGPALKTHFGILANKPAAPPGVRVHSLLACLRMHRHGADWEAHAAAERLLRELFETQRALQHTHLADAEVEAGYRLIAKQDFAAARELLQARALVETRRARPSPRLAELHFYAGVACWLGGDRDWGKFHFCWVQENLPDDRLARRAYIAAAAEVMPYVNPELGGFKADRRGIGTGTIVQGYQAALRAYRGLLPRFEAGALRGGMSHNGVLDVDKETDITKLVRSLQDGNDFVLANNKVVRRLVQLGPQSIDACLDAYQDRGFLGRAYALWAAARVMQKCEASHDRARDAVAQALRSNNPRIRAIARSCQTILTPGYHDPTDTTPKGPKGSAAPARRGGGTVVPNRPRAVPAEKAPAWKDPELDVRDRLSAYMRDPEVFPQGFCGSVLVAKDGRVLLHESQGLADATRNTPMPKDALWDWCSVTKQFTAAAVLKLQMQGKLGLDDPITKHFPEAGEDKAAVTIRHLLTHTSGLKNDRGYGRAGLFDRDACMAYLLSRPLETKPGEVFRYNNSGYFLLAGLVERASKQRFEDYLRQQVLQPAQLMRAGCIGDPHLDLSRVPFGERGRSRRHFAYGSRLSWGYRGAGGVVASVGDMLAWHQALRSRKVLDAPSIQQMFKPGKSGYGLGWFVGKSRRGARLAWHSGNTGSLVTFFLRYLDDDVVVAIAYSSKPKVHPQRTATRLAAMVEGLDVGELPAREPAGEPAGENQANPVETLLGLPATKPKPVPAEPDYEALFRQLERPSRYTAVLDRLAAYSSAGKQQALEVLRRLSKRQARAGTSAELRLRFTLLGKELARRELERLRRRDVQEKLGAVEAARAALAAAATEAIRSQRLADLQSALSSLRTAIESRYPAGTETHTVPR